MVLLGKQVFVPQPLAFGQAAGWWCFGAGAGPLCAAM
jgi:hypothetical protein